MMRLLIIFWFLASLPVNAEDIFTKPGAGDVKKLIAKLGDANLRRGAADALARIGMPAVPELRKSLQSSSVEVRIWAAYTLGKIERPASSAVKALAASLKSPDRNLRAVAARSLGQIRMVDEESLQLLAAALADDDVRVRRYAATALGKIGPAAKKAIPHLVRALADHSVRKLAVAAIKRIGAAAVPVLIATLENKTVRMEAIDALRSIDPAAARRAGVHKISREDLAALAVSIADPNKDTAARVAHIAALSELGNDAVPALLAVFGDETQQVSRAASSAFSQIGPQALPQLIKAMKHQQAEVRAAAADALAAVGADAKPAVSVLASALMDADRGVRHRVAAAIDRLGPVADEAIPALIVVMNNNREQEATRQLAIKALSQMGPSRRQQVIKALQEVQDQGNFGVRSLAKQMLKQMETK